MPKGPPTAEELAALERAKAEARRLAGSVRDHFRCPWCATTTDNGGACHAHRSLERLFQQASGGQSG